MALESFPHDALVFLRPRGSGKLLALSSLAHFHGREHLPDYKPLFEVSVLQQSSLFAQGVSLHAYALLLFCL
jgi:hypothetical protein